MGYRNAPAVRMAVCGVTAALASAIMLVGTWVPAATFCCPVLASLLLIPVEREYGVRLSLCWYGAVAALSLVLAADKEAALLFALLGWYPVCKPRLDRLRHKWLRRLGKLALFQAALLVYAAVLRLVFPGGALEGGLLAAVWLLACVTFGLYDLLLGRLTVLYLRRLRFGK